MKRNKLFKILAVLIIIAVLIFIRWNSELNRNNRDLRDRLLEGDLDSRGKAEELFQFDYDRVYVFEPYQSKDEIEEEIGFKSRVIEETVSEGMMNILFLRGDSEVAYLYGYGQNNGYYLSLEAGEYPIADFEEFTYELTRDEVGNSSGPEETYLNYTFYEN